MGKSYVFEGKTSTEAIDNGLKELGVSKNKVDIKILEQEDKRSFFNILAPRVVKVEITLKDNVTDEVKPKESKKENNNKESKQVVTHKTEISEDDISVAVNDIKRFMDEFAGSLKTKITYNIKVEDNLIKIDVDGNDTGYLIGYRGEVLNSLQTILSNIACKSLKERVRVSLNISGYRGKRTKDLETLADKIANTVIKKGRDITLEPMSAYERKIIHTKLQDNEKIKTYSIGVEPYRKVVVALKK